MDNSLLELLSELVKQLAERNMAIMTHLIADGSQNTLYAKLTDFLQLQAIKENAEVDQLSVIKEINSIIQNIYENAYHSLPLQEKIQAVKTCIEEIQAGIGG